MKKELCFLGCEKNGKEIVKEVNIYNKNEIIKILENNLEFFINNNYLINLGLPHDFNLNLDIIRKYSDDDEFIINDTVKAIELYLI